MTDAQAKAICAALAYIIKEIVPVPKTTAAKQKREEIFEALVNAGRPAKGAGSVARSGVAADPAPAAAQAPSAFGQPDVIPLTMTVIMPPEDGAPTVRPGTVFGTPKDPRRALNPQTED